MKTQIEIKPKSREDTYWEKTRSRWTCSPFFSLLCYALRFSVFLWRLMAMVEKQGGEDRENRLWVYCFGYEFAVMKREVRRRDWWFWDFLAKFSSSSTHQQTPRLIQEFGGFDGVSRTIQGSRMIQGSDFWWWRPTKVWLGEISFGYGDLWFLGFVCFFKPDFFFLVSSHLQTFWVLINGEDKVWVFWVLISEFYL